MVLIIQTVGLIHPANIIHGPPAARISYPGEMFAATNSICPTKKPKYIFKSNIAASVAAAVAVAVAVNVAVAVATTTSANACGAACVKLPNFKCILVH